MQWDREPPVISSDMPVITPREVGDGHRVLDLLTNSLGEYDAENTWRMIQATVDGKSPNETKQYLSMLLVLSLQRIKEIRK